MKEALGQPIKIIEPIILTFLLVTVVIRYVAMEQSMETNTATAMTWEMPLAKAF